MTADEFNQDQYQEELNERAGCGGCAEMWDAVTEMRENDNSSSSVSRRRLLKGAGTAGTVSLASTLGLTGKVGAAIDEDEISSLLESDPVQKLVKEFNIPPGQVTSTEKRNGDRESKKSVIPLGESEHAIASIDTQFGVLLLWITDDEVEEAHLEIDDRNAKRIESATSYDIDSSKDQVAYSANDEVKIVTLLSTETQEEIRELVQFEHAMAVLLEGADGKYYHTKADGSVKIVNENITEVVETIPFDEYYDRDLESDDLSIFSSEVDLPCEGDASVENIMSCGADLLGLALGCSNARSVCTLSRGAGIPGLVICIYTIATSCGISFVLSAVSASCAEVACSTAEWCLENGYCGTTPASTPVVYLEANDDVEIYEP